ncbi:MULTISPECIES: ABC transporter substrate-binding protein [unclassified Synechococcus]|uniref:ABC transporter substrate-binding protein n=1 Tax=unclassified Synechococcus TaxID=2626047 RepID=UPI0008FF2CDB|nr:MULTISPECIES: ABC transporter substrate-binding protein [unclassified Synechococcus]APD48859.1 sulfonate ABC transporter substrate-binding protein [Synechococcus sp. SynAce01]MCT0246480.1 ABC transporter substrate-binding protein [Synechococcus sp. CS-601]TWB93255.1 NitT/TauT family transport system substrate-binding protein [Synechococcus sp. Ace-Pa]
MTNSSAKKRNRALSLLLLATLSGGLLASCQQPPQEGNAPVRIGYSAWPGWFPWKVSEEKGLFEQAGVPVTLQWFDGYLDSINALNAGQLDCNSQTLGDTISSVAGGADLRVVLTNDNSTGNDQVIAAEGISSVADLKGKSVAAEEGTVDHYLLLLGLKQAGLSADDITFVPLETGAAAAAFVAAQVDAVGVFAPFTTQALKRSGSTTLFSSADFPGAISDHLVCRTEFVEKNPEQLQNVVNAWFATLAEIKAQPESSLAIMAERAGVTEAEYSEYDAGTTIFSLEDNRQAFQPGDTMQSLPFAAAQISDFLQEVGLAETPPDLTNLFDSRFVEAVK